MHIAGHKMLDSPDNPLPGDQGLSDTPVILLLIGQLIQNVRIAGSWLSVNFILGLHIWSHINIPHLPAIVCILCGIRQRFKIPLLRQLYVPVWQQQPVVSTVLCVCACVCVRQLKYAGVELC